ncbi:MAG: tRNA pseudouridine(13) synthase TruD, partial [Planctomycetota bacterium]
TEKIQHRLKDVEKYGLLNYFDEQRFGSVRGGHEFIAKQLIRRDFEGALKNALTATSKEDRRAVKEIRMIIRQHWGDWLKCMQLLPRSSERSIINYLKDHPTAFSRAFELLNQNLVLLYLHAYQSYLWNKALGSFMCKQESSYFNETTHNQIIKIPYLLGEFIFYHTLSQEELSRLKKLSIPFITHKTIFSEKETEDIYNRLLQEEGIALTDFRIRGMKKTYFRKGERAVVIFPENLLIKNIGPDDLNRGKLKLTMEFALPRGSYATILIKRLSA